MYIDKPSLFTDYYELTMAGGYHRSGLADKEASFDYFFRETPFGGGFVIFCGLRDLLETLEGYSFGEEELTFLGKQGFDPDFLRMLEGFRFRGEVWSVREGEVIFPGEPVVRIDGTLLETQLVETLVLNILNFQSLIATKAARLRLAAGERTILDFGLRRSQGLGGIHATRAAIIGGLDGTSNVYSAWRFGVPAGGTMAHSWVQAFDDELTAFRTFADYYGPDSILLVDTYDTLGSGVPNAIAVAKEMKLRGERIAGIRLDSGDLAYFAGRARQLLDESGLGYVKIAVSNQLDEYEIAGLVSQEVPADIFGVGTRLVTGHESSSLDGVYKLIRMDGQPRLKISENRNKITLPGRKKIFRHINENGTFSGDAIVLEEEEPAAVIHPKDDSKRQIRLSGNTAEPLLRCVMSNGTINRELPGIPGSARYVQERLMKLDNDVKRFDKPRPYTVGISQQLALLQKNLLKTATD